MEYDFCVGSKEQLDAMRSVAKRFPEVIAEILADVADYGVCRAANPAERKMNSDKFCAIALRLRSLVASNEACYDCERTRFPGSAYCGRHK
jgi:hypothetical protein